jgi:general secretion pathway protein A
VILCGQPELTPFLQRRELRALQQRITQYCSLRPLTLAETHSYVVERLQAAGLAGPSPFSEKSIELLHLYSQGVPRLINQVCDGALVIGFNTQQRLVQPDAIEESATQLQLSVDAVDERPKAAGRDADLEVVESALDLLIGAMKRKRTSTWE